MNVKLFFQKYSKQVIIVLFILFSLKSIQSCNRQLSVTTKEKQIIKLNDSLTTVIQRSNDTIKVLQLKLELANVYKDAANTRADAVQSVAEKITKNTTVKVEK